jgi:hypothetical protein
MIPANVLDLTTPLDKIESIVVDDNFIVFLSMLN